MVIHKIEKNIFFMSNAMDIQELLDANKTNIPDNIYLQLSNKCKSIYENVDKELYIVAVVADSLVHSYLEDDEPEVVYKLKQRILKTKCTPISDHERDDYSGKGPIEILEKGKYREKWLQELKNGVEQDIPDNMFPISVNTFDDNTSCVIVSKSSCSNKKQKI